MSREIKFRALIKIEGQLSLNWEYYSTFDQPVWIDSKFAEIIVKDLQYTGLKDKNGKEIYEGDIVKVIYEEVRDRSNTDDPDDWCEENASIHEVHWCGDYPSFDIKPFPEYWESNGLQHAIVEHSIEIIGNIHEHDHLLNPPR